MGDKGGMLIEIQNENGNDADVSWICKFLSLPPPPVVT